MLVVVSRYVRFNLLYRQHCILIGQVAKKINERMYSANV